MKQIDYEEEAQKIANEGLDYYLQSYGAHVADPELQRLYDKGKDALNSITEYFEHKGVDLNEY